MVERKLEAGFGVSGDCEEGVGGLVTDGDLANELKPELVNVEVEAAVEVEDPVAGVDVLYKSPLLYVLGSQLSGFARY